jgi:UDP-N-acetylmuramate dehydrogenase
MEILENVSLSDFTTMRVGGPARFFCKIKNEKDLKEAVSFVKQKNIPFFILGGGSNVVFSDDGFQGMILKIELSGIVFREEKGKLLVTAGAGVVWDKLVEETVTRGLYGLENLSFIPGLVGSAPVQNIGAYGVEVKDFIVSVNALDTETLKIKKFNNKECSFGYRDSFFKTTEGKKYIITGVVFSLKKNGELKTDYKDVKEYFSSCDISSPNVRDVRNALIEIRTKKLPDTNKDFTAGSFFKNIVMPDADADELLKKYPDIAVYSASPGYKKFATAWVLDHICGLRGMQKGNVGTYKNQALVIVNNGNATAKEIMEFAEGLQKCVKEKTGIEIEREVIYIE